MDILYSSSDSYAFLTGIFNTVIVRKIIESVMLFIFILWIIIFQL